MLNGTGSAEGSPNIFQDLRLPPTNLGDVAASPTYGCDFSRFEPYEMGALIATLMCWPSARDEPVRHQRFAEMCGWSFRHLVAQTPDGEWQPWTVKPGYAFAKPVSFNFGSKEFAKRMSRMVQFGHDAIVFLKAEATGKVELFPGMKRLTVSSLIDLKADAEAASGRTITDPANFRRLWRLSLPVIHIAAAWQVLHRDNERAGKPLDDLACFLDRVVIEDWIRIAMDIEPFGRKAFPGISNRQIRLRLSQVPLALRI